MRTSTKSEELIRYCDHCESHGCTALVFCDKCPLSCCVHLSSKIDTQLWCVSCIESHGLDLEILARWPWAGDRDA